MSDDLERNLETTGQILAAADRLADRGLAKREPRGVNDDGLQTLADLLTVLTFQTGGGPSRAEQVCSAAARAMLSAVGDLYQEAAGNSPGGTQTQQLLASATKVARTASS